MQGVDLQNFAYTRSVLGISSDSRIYPYLLLIPVFFGIFIAADDQTVVVTILPEIIRDFKFTTYELDRASWTITGYLLGYIAAMPLIGSISDILGHRNMYIFCIIVFLIISPGLIKTSIISTLSKSPISGTGISVDMIIVLFITQFYLFSAM